MNIKSLLSPEICYRWAKKASSILWPVVLLVFVLGLVDGLLIAPADYQQGNAYRIMFIHVPSAIMSMGIYAVMAISAFIFLIWKIKIFDMIAKASAPIGASLTLLTLITGSLWGKPTWGTFWIWDARLTSELILLFIYFGIIALRNAIPDKSMAAKASSFLILIGALNLPIVHYSVYWWNTLHQGATLLKWGTPSIAFSMLHPLLLMLLGFILFYIWILSVKLQSEILWRERHSMWVKNHVF